MISLTLVGLLLWTAVGHWISSKVCMIQCVLLSCHLSCFQIHFVSQKTCINWFFTVSPFFLSFISSLCVVAFPCISLLPIFASMLLLYFLCVNGWRISPNQLPSIDAPPQESPTSPLILENQIQIQKEHRSKREKEEGGQTASRPCFEIHSAGVRRSSEPLSSSLPQPHTEPPRETFTNLTVACEQRFSP